MGTVSFFTRSSAKKGVLAPVFCRVRSGRNIDFTAKSGIQIQPDYFNNNSGEVRQIAEATNKDQQNKDLRKLKDYIFDEISKVTDPANIKPDWLTKTIDTYWNPEKYKEKVLDLFSFIQDFIDKAPTRINYKSGRPVCYKMQREYERTFYYLKEYSKEKGKTPDFKDIDLDFYYSFVEYLQGKNLATNTIGKKIQTLKIFLNAAADRGLNQYRHYKSPRFNSISEESESIYLNQDELEKIYELDLTDRPCLDRARDLFIVGCWTGVRFSDISLITPKSIKDGYIGIAQGKTDGKVIIPVHPTVEAILSKYDGTLPPTISNQKFNLYLKIIAKKSKINDDVDKSITKGGVKIITSYKKHELVTSHSGRRSFATNLYLMGVPSLDIMAITGHKTEASFRKYIKLTSTQHAEKVKAIWQSQVKLKVVR